MDFFSYKIATFKRHLASRKRHFGNRPNLSLIRVRVVFDAFGSLETGYSGEDDQSSDFKQPAKEAAMPGEGSRTNDDINKADQDGRG